MSKVPCSQNPGGLSDFDQLGTGTASSPFEIWNANQLYSLAKNPSGWSHQIHYIQCSSIDLSEFYGPKKPYFTIGSNLEGVGFFNAQYDGNKKTINGFQFKDNSPFYQPVFSSEGGVDQLVIRNDKNAIGLFSVIGPSGKVKKLRLKNTYIHIEGDQDEFVYSIGGLAGINHGEVANIQIENESEAQGHVFTSYSENAGLLIGHNRGKVVGIIFSGSVTGTRNIGGLIGLGDGKTYIVGVKGSPIVYQNEFAINPDTNFVFSDSFGGLIGRTAVSAYAENIKLDGQIIALSNVGGIIGSAESGSELVRNFYKGTVYASDDVGGLIGFTRGHVKIKQSYFRGPIFSIEQGDNTGGLVGIALSQDGKSLSVENSYSYIKFQHNPGYPDRRNIGGLIGRASGVEVINSYSRGVLYSEYGREVGGLFGRIQSSADKAIKNSFSAVLINISQQQVDQHLGRVIGVAPTNGSDYLENVLFASNLTCVPLSECNSSYGIDVFSTNVFKTESLFIYALWPSDIWTFNPGLYPSLDF